jgi:hypothetical protein
MAGFEPKIPASKRPQTHALDRAATGIGRQDSSSSNLKKSFTFYGTHDRMVAFVIAY